MSARGARQPSSSADGMVESFRRGGVGGLAMWQAVVAVIACFAPSGMSATAQALAHAAVAAVMVIAYRWPGFAFGGFCFAYAVSAVDLAVVDSITTAVGFAALFTVTIVGATPVLSLGGWQGYALAGLCLAISTVGLSFRDEPRHARSWWPSRSA
ncbi:MAG TPA: hypothetical protein VNZ66_02115 [Aeromicrobium sp.]|nr:hypothetical protein [Aeromicrobium sp.]